MIRFGVEPTFARVRERMQQFALRVSSRRVRGSVRILPLSVQRALSYYLQRKKEEKKNNKKTFYGGGSRLRTIREAVQAEDGLLPLVDASDITVAERNINVDRSLLKRTVAEYPEDLEAAARSSAVAGEQVHQPPVRSRVATAD